MVEYTYACKNCTGHCFLSIILEGDQPEKLDMSCPRTGDDVDWVMIKRYRIPEPKFKVLSGIQEISRKCVGTVDRHK